MLTYDIHIYISRFIYYINVIGIYVVQYIHVYIHIIYLHVIFILAHTRKIIIIYAQDLSRGGGGGDGEGDGRAAAKGDRLGAVTIPQSPI